MLKSRYEIAIVGGGLIGASLAVALRGSGKSVVIIEPAEIHSAAQPSFDERTVALTYNGRQIYTAMAIWDDIARYKPQPILDIHISDRGHFGQTHLAGKQVGVDALGYVVPTRVMGEVLWKQIRADSFIEVLCPANVVKISPEKSSEKSSGGKMADGKTADGKSAADKSSARLVVEFTGESGAAEQREFEAGMVVLADGGRSELAAQVGIHAQRTPYSQSAILAIVQVDRAHHGRAYERFTAEGPIALLPHSELVADADALFQKDEQKDGQKNQHRYAVVWTIHADKVALTMAYSDAEYLAELQRVFGDRAGTFLSASSRKSYPLISLQVASPAAGNVVAVGNAAHTVHPVAGQGFNLGLRDIALLAENIWEFDALKSNYQSLIERYVQSRKHDNKMVNLFTHELIRTFTHSSKSITLARNIGLQVVEHCPAIKRFILSRTMGLKMGLKTGKNSRQSRLMAGIPLSPKRPPKSPPKSSCDMRKTT